MNKFELKRKANELDVGLNIGKNALSEAVLKELEKRLEKKQLLKVKVLPSFKADRKRIAEKLALDVKAELIEVKGSTIVLYKRKNTNIA